MLIVEALLGLATIASIVGAIVGLTYIFGRVIGEKKEPFLAGASVWYALIFITLLGFVCVVAGKKVLLLFGAS